MAGKGEMHMLSAALFLLANSLFLTLRLTGDTGSFPKPLSAGEERMYLERSLAGDLEARNILVEHNLRLVAHIIKKYYTQAAEQEDLISIGTIGLIKAVDTFRPERKIRLATYASRCVENEVLMYFRSRKKLQGEVSLSDTIEPDAAGGALSLMDVVGCDDTMLSDMADREERLRIRELVGRCLTDREAEVIRRRYGLSGRLPQTQRQVAAALNEEGVAAPSVYCGRVAGCKGPYEGLWSGERISEMLRNETYIGSMVQGRQVKISYKSKKCLHQDRENWIVVPHTHAPLIDEETFRKVGLLVSSRRHTRCRTYDFLLKGLIFCHECGYPLAVLNRPNAKGEDVLYFVCRTYQRFTKDGACTTHYIKEKTVTDAVISRMREVCKDFLDGQVLLPMAQEAVRETSRQNRCSAKMDALQEKIESLTKNIDRMYTDRLSGLLPEADFQRIFIRLKDQRGRLEERLQKLEQWQKYPINQRDRALELTQRYRDTACASRELLVSLIERIELTENREVLIQLRFAQPHITKETTNAASRDQPSAPQPEAGGTLQ